MSYAGIYGGKMGGTAGLMYIDFHVGQDTTGSRSEFAK